MKVAREDVLKMIKELGNAPTADKWSKAQMEDRLKKFPGILEEDDSCESDDCIALLEELKEAVENEEEIEVTGDFPSAKAKAKAGKDKKGAAKASSNGTGKKSTPKGGPRKVGIISTIYDMLGKASEKKPVSKDQINAVLVKKFGPGTDADRKPEAMASTVSQQLSHHIKAKGVNIQKSDKGYWIKS